MASADPEARAAVLAEELEVLQSIYVDELEVVGPDNESLRIRVEAEEGTYSAESEPIVLSLLITYSPNYPDEAPEMAVELLEGDFDEDGLREMERELQSVAEESLGMAMVFTLASHLRDALTNYLQREKEAKAAEEARRRDAEIEAEAEKFRGTAVTPERFAAWRIAFEKEMAAAAAKAEEERIRREYKTPKEREEYRKLQQRPTGKELFQKGGLHSDKSLDHDEEAGGEGEELDLSQFGSKEEREKLRREEAEREERDREQKLREGLESDEE